MDFHFVFSPTNQIKWNTKIGNAIRIFLYVNVILLHFVFAQITDKEYCYLILPVFLKNKIKLFVSLCGVIRFFPVEILTIFFSLCNTIRGFGLHWNLNSNYLEGNLTPSHLIDKILTFFRSPLGSSLALVSIHGSSSRQFVPHMCTLAGISTISNRRHSYSNVYLNIHKIVVARHMVHH